MVAEHECRVCGKNFCIVHTYKGTPEKARKICSGCCKQNRYSNYFLVSFMGVIFSLVMGYMFFPEQFDLFIRMLRDFYVIMRKRIFEAAGLK